MQLFRACATCPLRAASCHANSSKLPVIPRLSTTDGGFALPGSLVRVGPLVPDSMNSAGWTSATIPTSSLNAAIS